MKRPMTDSSVKGYAYVALAAVMWASSGIAAKYLFLGGMTPLELAQVRATFGGLFLFIGIGLFARPLLRIALRDVGWFLLLGAVIMASVQATYLYAISKIQVMAAILIQYLAPLLVALYSVLFWGERFTPSKAMALGMASVGCYLVVGGYDIRLLELNRLGIIGGLASAVTFAAYALMGEWAMRRYSPWTVTLYALIFAAVTWNLALPPFKFVSAGPGLVELGLMLYIVLAGTIAPFGLYYLGINHIRSTRASITAMLEPLSAGFLAFVFLGEALHLLQLAGAGLVIAAVVTLQLYREESPASPEAIRNRS